MGCSCSAVGWVKTEYILNGDSFAVHSGHLETLDIQLGYNQP